MPLSRRGLRPEPARAVLVHAGQWSLGVLLASAAVACGTAVDPGTPLEGGGITGGPIDGSLVVHAIDAADGHALAGVEARLADGRAAGTNAEGAAIFEGVTGPQDVHLEHASYAAVDWLGVAGDHVTIPLHTRVIEPPPRGTIQATIEGWATMSAPEGQYLAAFAGYSRSADLDAPENRLATGPGTECVNDGTTTDCTFSFSSRAGTVAVFAVIAHGDPNGTPDDRTDDTLTPVGFAFADGVDVPDEGSVTGVALTPVDDLLAIQVGAVMLPEGLAAVVGVPGINLGDSGVLVFPALGTNQFVGPNLTGAFEDRTYWAVAIGRDDDEGQSWSVARNLLAAPPADTPTLEVPPPLPPPETSFSAPNALTLGGPTAATVWRIDVRAADHTRLQRVLVLDRRSDVTIATGAAAGMVEAIETSEHTAAQLSLPSLDTAPLRWASAPVAL